jgi:carbamoyltransferase
MALRIIGLSAYYHDSAAALVVDGEIVAAAQEERFTRKKHDPAFPANALQYCLRQGVLRPDNVDFVVFYDKPFLTFERLLETYLAMAPRGLRSFAASMPLWVREKLFQKSLLRDAFRETTGANLPEAKLLFTEHHVSHAASAFYPSPFEEAAVLVMDGVGEWATTSLSMGSGSKLEMRKEIHFPHSLGLLYSAFTYYTGFKVNSGEYKLMGLAPYGKPRYTQLILDHLIDLKPDGSYRLDLDYFDYCTGLRMTSPKFDTLFGGPARGSDQLLTQRHMDLAASVQAVLEEAVLRLSRSIQTETGSKNLCLAGGVALNCVANGKVLRDARFEEVWIQPASGDAGGAIGAALAGYYLHQGKPRVSGKDRMRGAYLGPEYSRVEIEERLRAAGAVFVTYDENDLLLKCVEALVAEKAVGWFAGRMEFGPRALGGRSILADARSPRMQSTLNLRVKFRESFRPFAPSVLREHVNEWFELDADSPYMLLTAGVKPGKRREMSDAERQLFGIDQLNVPRSDIPAVTHVDYSARIQTVHEETNPRYYALLNRFHAATGCPVLVNTSFNVRGEPIVCTPEDAFRCFMGTGIEVLAIGNCFLRKEDQNAALVQSYEKAFEPD